MSTPTVILSTAYLPPVQYFSKLLAGQPVLLERHETYPKQTYRNRCVIGSANGPLALSIPVVRPQGNRTRVGDVRLDNSVKWQREHWRALESAYRRSPYFELVADELLPFYTRPWGLLFEYNLAIIQAIARLLGVRVSIGATERFLAHYGPDALDLRQAIHPKPQRRGPDPAFTPTLYFQGFADRHGFMPNLSVLDLLCHCGREGVLLLR